ncbi:MAG: hypothetical protein RXO22_03960 [Thermocladium sp.]
MLWRTLIAILIMALSTATLAHASGNYTNSSGINPQSIENNLIMPFLSDAFNIISIIGGLSMWVLILAGIYKIFESKLSMTSWGRMSGLYEAINNFKWIFIGISTFYVLMYVMFYIANGLGANINPGAETLLMMKKLLISPFIEIANHAT